MKRALLFLLSIAIAAELGATAQAPDILSAPRVATWFTGHLIVPTGEMVHYVHMGYGSMHSSYIVLTIIKGEVAKQREMSLEEFKKFRHAQYEAFKKTPEYARALASVKGDKSEPTPDELTERFLFHYTSEEYLSRIFEESPP